MTKTAIEILEYVRENSKDGLEMTGLEYTKLGYVRQ